jgi:methyl-accepting chemotaxis protein
MKKLVAIVMTLTMLVSCIPMMAFADVKDDQDKAEKAMDQQVLDLQDFILESLEDKDFLAMYLYISDQVQDWKDKFDLFAQFLDYDGLTHEQKKDLLKLVPDIQQLDDYIKVANNYVKELSEYPEAQKAMEEYAKRLEDLREFFVKYGVDLSDYYFDEDDDIVDVIDKLYDAFFAVYDAMTYELVTEALDNAIKELARLHVQYGGDPESIDMILHQAWIIKMGIMRYASMDPDEAIDALIEDAQRQLDIVLKDVLKELKACLNEELAKRGLTEDDIKAIIEQAKELKEIIDELASLDPDEVINELIEEAKALAQEALEKAVKQILDEAEKLLEEQGITKENVAEFFEMLDELKDFVEEYKDVISEFDPDKAIESLIDIAQDLFDEYQDEIMEAAMDAATDLLEKFENGEFDEYLEPLGLTGQELEDLIVDAIAYAFGVMNGEGYLDVQEQLAEALDYIDDLLEENAELQLENDELLAALNETIDTLEALTEEAEKLAGELEQTKKDLDDAMQTITNQDATILDLRNTIEQLVQQGGEKDAAIEAQTAVIKKFINGYNVMKKKPALKKLKNVKKRTVKVTFKGLKKVKATKYQISYKTGKKKAKVKTWKKKTTKAKKLTYKLKKLKKGKKYTIKVRGVYSFKYEGKTYKFVSKWSKSNKVKVKK